MPVMRLQTLGNTPEWLKTSAVGLFRVPRGNPADCDLQYHDADEMWHIVEGRARILTEGHAYEVGPSDLVCTGMGDERHVLEVYKDVLGFYLEGELEGLKRQGHLHHDEHGLPVPQRRQVAGTGSVS